jgi:hypothetical protein
MSSVDQIFTAAAFDANATTVMGKAFDLACQNMGISRQPESVKEVMALRIIQAARSGERDPLRLAAKAMDAVGIHLA